MLFAALLCLLVAIVSAVLAWGGVIFDGQAASNAALTFAISFLGFLLLGILGLIPKDAPPASQTPAP